MNLPNKLTLLRVALVPVFLLFMYLEFLPHLWIALLVFILASITDAVDGHLARKNNQITTFGKFLDPLADKILVCAALICFIEKSYVSALPVIIIIAREFMVSGLRLVTAGKGIVVAAGFMGKLKTVFQMIAIIFILFYHGLDEVFGHLLPQVLFKACDIIALVLIIACTVLALISGYQYLRDYWKHIDTNK